MDVLREIKEMLNWCQHPLDSPKDNTAGNVTVCVVDIECQHPLDSPKDNTMVAELVTQDDAGVNILWIPQRITPVRPPTMPRKLACVNILWIPQRITLRLS